MGAVIVLSLVAIPLSVLVGAVRDRSLRRRSRFRLRLAAFVIAMAVPWMIEPPGAISEQANLTPVLLGLGWGLLLVSLAPVLLFRGSAPEPGSSDEGGTDPDDDLQPPDRPIGGIPLPDAEQPAKRVRGPHPRRRATPPRRSAPEPERRPLRR
jgi:hypothetical protein